MDGTSPFLPEGWVGTESEHVTMTWRRKCGREGEEPRRRQRWNDMMLSARSSIGPRKSCRRQSS